MGQSGQVLIPPPEDVAELLIQMTELEWPTSEDDRRAYFDALGLRDLDTIPQREDDPDSTWRRFTTSLPGVEGSCSVFREQFLGLSLFCYNEPGDDGPQARVGYPALRDHLSRRLGAPVEEWGTPREPACLWQPGPLLLDMYCFQRLRSGVMVGPSHAERSAAHGVAIEERPQPSLTTIQ